MIFNYPLLFVPLISTYNEAHKEGKTHLNECIFIYVQAVDK